MRRRNEIARMGSAHIDGLPFRRAARAIGTAKPQASIVASSAALIVAVGLFTGTMVRADDTDALDRELLEALEGKPPADSPERIVPRLLKDTRQAASRLSEGQLDDKTQTLQTQILADIDALLKQSAPPQPPPQNQQSPNSKSQQDDSQQSQSEQQQGDSQDGDSQKRKGEQDSDAAAKESTQRTTAGSESDAERERRLGLSTAAWGHLPPKVREQMRSAFSEEYLPEYDALVRRYYEALARQSQQRAVDEGAGESLKRD